MNKDIRMAIAELIGSFIFVTILIGGQSPAGVAFLGPFRAFFGLFIAMNVCFPICGHINPAVSLAMLIDKQISFKQFLFILPAQFIGAFLAAPLVWFLTLNYQNQSDFHKSSLLASFAPTPPGYYTIWSAMYEQFYATMLFVIGVFAVIDTKNLSVPTHYYRVLIPLLLLSVMAGLGGQTTGVYNPAADFGPRLWGLIIFGGDAFSNHDGYFFVPLCFPFIGAIAGKFAYHLLSHVIRDSGNNNALHEPLM